MSSNKKITPFGLVIQYMSSRYHIYVIGFVVLFITSLGQVSQPRIIGYMVNLFNKDEIPNYLTKGSIKESFTYLFILYLFSHLIRFLGCVGWRLTLSIETHRAGNWLRSLILKSACYFKTSDLNTKYTPGILMSVSTSDAHIAKFIFGFLLLGTFDVIFLFVLLVFGMLQIDVSMTLGVISILPFLVFFSYKLAKIELERFTTSQEFLAKFNDKTSQAISTIKLQRLTETGYLWEKRLTESAFTYRSGRIRAFFINFLFYPLMGTGVIASYIIFFYIGIKKIEAGTMTIGGFVTMQGFILMLHEPMLDIGYMISEWQRAVVGLKRVCDVLNHEQDQNLLDHEQSSNLRGKNDFTIKLENVSFSFPNSENKIINNFSAFLEQGERLGIKGPIGSGKSTLLSLISGLERNYSGKIEIGNIDIRNYTHHELRDLISIVDQKVFLFADTVRKNLEFDMELIDEEIWDVLKTVQIEKEIRSLPDGLDTELGEWGVNLSGGQKQRLTLARAILRKPKVLLLDDCLSAVDTVTEEIILNNLNLLLKDSTVLWVAHRDSTLKYCNKIVEINEF